jgi:hypothetical protein
MQTQGDDENDEGDSPSPNDGSGEQLRLSADKLYMELFGQSRSRLGWNDPSVLFDKDPIQEEQASTSTSKMHTAPPGKH